MMVMSVAFSDGVTNRRAGSIYIIHSCFPFTTEKGVTRSLVYARRRSNTKVAIANSFKEEISLVICRSIKMRIQITEDD